MAAEQAVALLSYDHRSIDEDLEQTRSALTGMTLKNVDERWLVSELKPV